MKIIEQGRPKDWWVGKEAKCKCCGTKVELEKSDKVYVTYDRNNSAQTCSFQCPHCKEQVWVYPSDL